MNVMTNVTPLAHRSLRKLASVAFALAAARIGVDVDLALRQGGACARGQHGEREGKPKQACAESGAPKA